MQQNDSEGKPSPAQASGFKPDESFEQTIRIRIEDELEGRIA